MQEFRDEFNEHRIDKLEERVDIIADSISNEWDHNLTMFKDVMEVLETIQSITENLDDRARRLESIVLFKEEEDS